MMAATNEKTDHSTEISLITDMTDLVHVGDEPGDTDMCVAETDFVDTAKISSLTPPPTDMTDDLINRSDASTTNESSVAKTGTVDMEGISASIPADIDNHSEPGNSDMCVTETEAVDTPDISRLTPPPTDMADDLINRSDGPATNERNVAKTGTVNMVSISSSIPPQSADIDDRSEPGNSDICVTETETVDTPDISRLTPPSTADDLINRGDRPATNERSVVKMGIVDMVGISTIIPPQSADSNYPSEPGDSDMCVTETGTVDKANNSKLKPPTTDMADDLIFTSDRSTANDNERSVAETGTVDLVGISTVIPPLADSNNHFEPDKSESCVAETETVDKKPDISTLIPILTDDLTDKLVHGNDRPGDRGDHGSNPVKNGNVRRRDRAVNNERNIFSLMSPSNEMSNNLIHEPDGCQSNLTSHASVVTNDRSSPSPPICGMSTDSDMNPTKNAYLSALGINKKPVVVLGHPVSKGSLATGYTYSVHRLEASKGKPVQHARPSDDYNDDGQMEDMSGEDCSTDVHRDEGGNPMKKLKIRRNKNEDGHATPSSIRLHLSRVTKLTKKPSYTEDQSLSSNSEDIEDDPDNSGDSSWTENDDIKPVTTINSRTKQKFKGMPNTVKCGAFTCPKCDKSFKRKSHLTRHLKLHPSKKKKRSSDDMSLCSDSEDDDGPDKSRHSNSKVSHNNVNSEERPYPCPTCGKSFKTKWNVSRHIKTHQSKPLRNNVNTFPRISHRSGERPYPCPKCDKHFKSKWDVSRHIKTHSLSSDERPHPCPTCDKRFKSKWDVSRHMKKHSKPKKERKKPKGMYGCLTCGANFSHVPVLREHIRANQGHTPKHQCTRCERVFFSKSKLQRHIEVHDNGHPFKCDQCDFSTEYAPSFKKHVANHSPVYDQPCPKCDKIFKCEADVRRHVETVHMNTMPKFLCTVCGKALKTEYALNAHMVTIHSDAKPYECTECGKRCSTRSQLANHTKKHGSKALQCFICGKRFFFKATLDTHMLCHSEDMPYECEFCGKKFKRQHNLDSHMRTHVGQWKFSCDICGRAFKWSHILRNHMKTHIKIEIE